MAPSRTGTRVLLVLVGCSVLLCYVGLAALGYLGLTLLWHSVPGPATAVVLVVGTAVVVGTLSYRFGTTQLLAGLEAVDLPRSRAPAFYRRIDRLTDRMAVDEPTVLVAALPTPNAFAIGSARNGTVVLDRSLLRLLTVDELEGLVAHELAHLESHDAFVQTLAYSVFRTIVGVVFLVSVPPVLVVVGVARALAWARGRPWSWRATPFGRVLRWIEHGVLLCFLLVTVVVRAHSRHREYAADDRAATVTGDPLALARALRKIDRAGNPRRGLLSPLYVSPDDEDALSRLLSTHPSTAERIERLADRARNATAAVRAADR
ncbi:M48 family metallopeptidase [Halopiger djelfimassiliensis]|uniref:M48 family metallopeptidase n=1 Tax=Halopiger djelfimassiliensis TaxID=1293047 RepID=UPI0006780F75|nr:M48 family metalloprotease [Halopiger djelfimassiliensis]